jgi:hypothetical protein
VKREYADGSDDPREPVIVSYHQGVTASRHDDPNRRGFAPEPSPAASPPVRSAPRPDRGDDRHSDASSGALTVPDVLWLPNYLLTGVRISPAYHAVDGRAAQWLSDSVTGAVVRVSFCGTLVLAEDSCSTGTTGYCQACYGLFLGLAHPPFHAPGERGRMTG